MRRIFRTALFALTGFLLPWLFGMWLTMDYYSFLETGRYIHDGAGMTRYTMLVFAVGAGVIGWLTYDS